MRNASSSTGGRMRAPLTLAVLAVLTSPAHAIDFTKGELEGSWDTTISYGASWRMQDRDPDLVAKSAHNPLIFTRNVFFPSGTPLAPLNGSTGFAGSPDQFAAPGRSSPNRDDGNRKYDKHDLIANTAKITSELSLKYRDWGGFFRATYFHDFEHADDKRLSKAARDVIGERFRWLDGFVYKNFHYGYEDSMTGSVRVGRQVISWGESTFIQNGINVVNPVDLSALRVAGAELKEAFLPVDAIWGSLQISDNVSAEAFILKEWEEIEIDASGTYFSAADFGGPGGSYVTTGFGTVPQPVNNPELFNAVCNGTPAGWQSSDRFGELSAQFGAGLATQLIAGGCSASVRRSENRNARDTGQYGAAVRWLAPNLGDGTEFGFYAMNYHSRLPVLSVYAATGAPAGGRPVPGMSYFLEYPEDIKLLGFSWNTSLPGGIAWQGELSRKYDAPLQVDDIELLLAGVSSLNAVIPVPAAQFRSQLGQFRPGQYIAGYRKHDVDQIQMTFTKAFPEIVGSDQLVLVGEIGGTHVKGMPKKGTLRYESEGTDFSGGCDINSVGTVTQLPSGQWVLAPPYNLTAAGCLRNPRTEAAEGFATPWSWGYRLAAVATYNSVFGTPVNLVPRLAFNHDVRGRTPGPGGNFLEGRKSFTAGIEANWRQNLVFDLSYTGFTGAEPYNQSHDRDFASFNVRYSF